MEVLFCVYHSDLVEMPSQLFNLLPSLVLTATLCTGGGGAKPLAKAHSALASRADLNWGCGLQSLSFACPGRDWPCSPGPQTS
jgi:hypothetical protein